MRGHNKQLGERGETRAAEYLENAGYCIVYRNYRTPYAEIDIVAEKDGTLAFVEVKTRASDRFGAPRLAVDRKKQQKIATAALSYLQQNALEPLEIRFDVIECTKNGVTHLKDAFRCGEEL